MTQSFRDNPGPAVELTVEGEARLDEIARGNDVSADVVQTLLKALVRGGGMQAQFSHPDLGGMGQWSHGMIMIGDMFNDRLKARVGRLCTELSELFRHPALFEVLPDARGSASATSWWPEGLGHPRSRGSQNETRYAYFPEQKRLAIEDMGEIRVYDTGDHEIDGVSQQQGRGQDLAFHTRTGSVRAHDLPLAETAQTKRGWHASSATTEANPKPDDIVQTIEKLHDLMRKGIVSEADFSEKKTELLARI